MSHKNGQQPGPVPPSPTSHNSVDEWEHWEDDDDVVTPILAEEQVLVEDREPSHIFPSPSRTRSTYLEPPRPTSSKVQRLKSRKRQKAQNAKAGIKLITDMSNFRLQQHIATQLKTRHGEPVKFVDAAALRALEGDPSSASVGNWNWLRKGRDKGSPSPTPQSSARSAGQELTPGDAPIMIGLAIPPQETGIHEDRNQSQSAESTPTQAKTGQRLREGAAPDAYSPPTPPPPTPPPKPAREQQHTPPAQQVSMWSPDTPSTSSSRYSRATSSVYSQMTTATGSNQNANREVPPVPALPTTYTQPKPKHQRLVSLDCGANSGDSDDGGTPCTLFEEDGSPSPRRAVAGKGTGFTPDSAGSRAHGWWDHVVTPFMDKRFTFTSRRTRLGSPKDSPPDQQHQSPGDTEISDEKQSYAALEPVPHATPPPIVRAPTPRRTPTPPSTQQQASNASGPSPRRPGPITVPTAATSEKPKIIVTPDIPPPYSPPRNPNQAGPYVRYHAVFPPGHPLQAQFPPSPGPGSPGLAATMTSQGATAMTDIPITPTIPREMPQPPQAPLPTRPLASRLPHEYSHDSRGSEHTVERSRRRHEKEDAVASRLGSLWRGRGCVPSTGCVGRSGREGRMRRRVWMGVLGALIIIVVLAIVLPVMLIRPKAAPDVQSIWVNLTDFPPMPTGALTVAGPDNTVARSGCTKPSTIWSCSLPKDDQESVEPYRANQPTVIMEIQWDNSTEKQWDVPNGEPPNPVVSRRDVSAVAQAGNFMRQRRAERFDPSPKPPNFREMWFLGNTTDDIRSDEKAGEPTPFYISILDSLSDGLKGDAESETLRRRQTTVGDDLVKDIVSPPDLLNDGTPAPAVMLPNPVQQPVRLYDRGLPTEHYGFYTYFKRTIYVKSIEQDTGQGDVPLDENGGCSKTEANHLVTWSETRMLVRLWTRRLGPDGATLVDKSAGDKGINGTQQLARPGTMPYPVTITLDTHGGDPEHKFVWQWPMDDRQHLDELNPKLLPNDLSFAGSVINHRKDNNTSFGGFDGGQGGCKCEWVNWV